MKHITREEKMFVFGSDCTAQIYNTKQERKREESCSDRKNTSLDKTINLEQRKELNGSLESSA